MLGIYAMAVIAELADIRGLLIGEQDRALPDIGFDVIPYTPSAVWVPDALNQLMLFIVILRIFCSVKRKRLACAFMNLHITLMILRCACMPFTTFPAPSPLCYQKYAERPDHILLVPIKRILERGVASLSSWCHDLLFSGHTVFLIIGALFLHDSPGEIWWRIAGWSCSVSGCLMLIATRIHYTTDVIVAVILSVLVYDRWRDELLTLFRAEPERLD